MDQGFAEYDNENARLHTGVAGAGPEQTRGSSSREQTDKAIAFVDRHADERWFLWVHYYDPHYAYEPHPEVPPFGADRVALYDGEIRFTDRHIGRLLDDLRAKGLYDKTVVVVTGDHGEGFGEHGVELHGYHLYAPQTKVPLIVRVPGLAAAPLDDARRPRRHPADARQPRRRRADARDDGPLAASTCSPATDDATASCSSSSRTRATTRCAPASSRALPRHLQRQPRHRAGRSIASIAIRARPRDLAGDDDACARHAARRRALVRRRAGPGRRRRGAARRRARRSRRRSTPTSATRCACSPSTRPRTAQARRADHADLDVRGARRRVAPAGRCSSHVEGPSKRVRQRRPPAGAAVRVVAARPVHPLHDDDRGAAQRAPGAYTVWAGLFKRQARARRPQRRARRSTNNAVAAATFEVMP